MELVWKEPTPSVRGRSATGRSQVREALKANPNKWALVGKYNYTYYPDYLRREGFEMTLRSVGGGQYELYARFVGTPTD